MIEIIKGLVSFFSPRMPARLAYMLQSTEYSVGAYLKWFWRTNNFARVATRRELNKTRAARLLVLGLGFWYVIELAVGIIMVHFGLTNDLAGGIAYGLATIIATPLVAAHIIVVPLILGKLFIIGPRNDKLILESEKIFAEHKGIKIAVVGSYGKTSMKELLKTVLSEGLNVAATPANKNVQISHAHFAKSLTGQEDVVIVEYGEGAPGDVARMARATHPTHAVVTGVAPAHLDHYKTLLAAGQDIFSIGEYVDRHNLFVNGESPDARSFIPGSAQVFDGTQALGWRVADVKSGLDGTSFSLKKGHKTVKLTSGLVGAHQVGFLAFVSAYALQLGLTVKQVQDGLSKTKPFEHRMQPYGLGGAVVVDDTYNGNLEGIRAGTNLLKEADVKGRKIYVTPGLVDQGEETKRVHEQVGELIAKANPDVVVLMKNSVTEYIKDGLTKGKYSGDVRVETEPLQFYLGLRHFVAAGDVVVMQNDWTDNYN